MEGALVAIRTKQNEISIFHVYQRLQARMAKIADRIVITESEETHS